MIPKTDADVIAQAVLLTDCPGVPAGFSLGEAFERTHMEKPSYPTLALEGCPYITSAAGWRGGSSTHSTQEGWGT